MLGKDKIVAGHYNRRLQLIKPTAVRDPVTNEEKIEDVVAYSSYPAYRDDRPTGEGENLDSNLVSGKVRVAWEIRFIPKLGIKTDWKIRDIFDGTMYTIVAPPTEIGFREGYRLLTEIAQ
ncbi:hypothetical protein [Dyadobacter sp. CY312]|uniref:phage head completion protein n=1 Tax=Dyadobacter sp. CY312 TaxID=2907303 RepID=UPI001F218CD2|nr:hypothetical protein [Dyadobacter sp. CY312]MCE7038989.1 hypothetical protein [Dyadobacter sp. CY312]